MGLALALVIVAWVALDVWHYNADAAHRERAERLRREQEDFDEL